MITMNPPLRDPDSEDQILRTIRELGAAVTDLSGIACPEAETRLDVRRNKQGRLTFQGRIGYRGPRQSPGWPRVLLAITNDEPVLDPPVPRSISHSYPDALPVTARVGCYSLEELIAEQTRALIERTRPRDLYDVVYLLDNLAGGVDLTRARDLFARKCAHKGIPSPAPAHIVVLATASAELRADWDAMLRHQPPVLPSFESVLARLAESIAWITAGTPLAATTLPHVPLGRGEVVVPAAPFRSVRQGGSPILDVIAFAGANRLLLTFDYPDSTRRGLLRQRLVEPYSLRRPQTGNLLLYAWNPESDGIRAYNVARIRNPQITGTPFLPRYRVEFAAPHFPSSDELRPGASYLGATFSLEFHPDGSLSRATVSPPATGEQSHEPIVAPR